jgi:hypothetical protein
MTRGEKSCRKKCPPLGRTNFATLREELASYIFTGTPNEASGAFINITSGVRVP